MTHVIRSRQATPEESARDRARFGTGSKRKKREEKTKVDKPSKVGEPIRIGREGQKGRSFFDKASESAFNVLKSPKTTAVLATTLASLLTFGGAGAIGGAAAKAGGRAVITRTATSLTNIGRAGRFVKAGTSVTTQRAFVGKAGNFAVNKLFHAVRPIASRYAVNAKSAGLTTSLLMKITKVATSPAVLLGAIGTYPFAGFIKEEAVQQTGFGFNEAERNNDIEGMEMAIAETEDILNSSPSILNKIPFANILKELTGYFKAVAVKLEIDKRVLEKKRGEQSGLIETQFAQERKGADEAARKRKLMERERDAEYFRLIREGKFEEADELLNRELEGGES